MILEKVDKNIINAKIIWTWRNDRITRNNSINTNLIQWNVFLADFNSTYFANTIPPFFIKDNDILIGYIGCVDVNCNKVKIGININPDYRGKGYGKKSIKLLIDFLTKEKEKYKIEIIQAFIKKENIISQKIFIKNDFEFIENKNDLLVFEKYI